MKNLEQLQSAILAAGIPAVGVDSLGNVSFEGDVTGPQRAQAAAIVAAFSDAAFDYIFARRKAYPPMSDQLDAITKGLAYLAGKGMDLGPDVAAQIAAVAKVKSDFPKPS